MTLAHLANADSGQSDDAVARWSLDISAVHGLIASVAAGTAPANWVDLLLAGTRIADVNHNAVHLVGVYAGRKRMIGQRAIAYWPQEAWSVLAELLVAVATDDAAGTAATHSVSSLAFVDPALTVSTAGAGPDIVFVSMEGEPIDQRSLWHVRASEERYRNLIHHLPVALLQVDSRPMTAIFENLRFEGVTDLFKHLEDVPALANHASEIVQVTDVNHNAIQLFGAGSRDQLIGPVGFLFAASPDTARRVIAAHFDGRRNHAERTKLRTFDSQIRDVELTVTYPTPPERLDVTLISLEDVTERVRTEAQLRQLQGEYAHAARVSMLGELATSIAHEVNQPLAAIVTNAETSLRWLGREDPNLAKVRQLTARLAESARVASEIVQRIRGMASQRLPEQVMLDLGEVMEEALLYVRHEIEVRSIDLSVMADECLPHIRGDRVQLQQVIVNLVLNAVQALEQGGVFHGHIVIEATAEEEMVVVSVRDDGPGIDANDLERIFGSFFTTKSDGIGIGLAICQSIIADHGGTISATNRAMGGAEFRVALPSASTLEDGPA